MGKRDKITEPPFGWYVGTVRGKPWFSDGSFQAAGKKESKRKPVVGGMDKIVRRACRKLQPVRFICAGKQGPSFDLMLVRLSSGTHIQKKYYDYFTKLGAEFFVGPQCGETLRDRFVVCKAGKAVIGIIMPVRVSEPVRFSEQT